MALHHDHLLQRLHVPAKADELGCQPVEQLRVAREVRLQAEILGRFDDPHAEELFPVAVDGYPCGERIGGAHDPPGQTEPVHRRALGQGRQGGGQAGKDLLAALIVLAADEKKCLSRLRQFGHHHDRRQLSFKILLRLAPSCRALSASVNSPAWLARK